MGKQNSQYQIIARASDFAHAIFERTAMIPRTRNSRLVFQVRYALLSFIENMAYSISEYHPAERYNYLRESQQCLDKIFDGLKLCKSMKLLDGAVYDSLEYKCKSLNRELSDSIKKMDTFFEDISTLG